MDDDVKRVLNLEDKLFEAALRLHLMYGHMPYLYECDDKNCAAYRGALGRDIFMLKYGTAHDLPASAVGEHTKVAHGLSD